MNKTYFKKRNDFSESHYKLPRSYGMFDIDIMQGEWMKLSDTISKKDDAVYIRYKCLKFDKDNNRFNMDRIKHIALFELKYKGNEHLKKKMIMNPGEPLWATFMTAKKLNCRFFLVVATNGKTPFHFIEYDIKLNQRINGVKTLDYNYKKDHPDIIKDFFNNILNIKS